MSIKKAFAKLFTGNILVTVSNLLRDTSIAAVFGSSRAVDSFFLAISIPVFIVTIASNAMRSACIPILTDADSNKAEENYYVLAKRIYLNLQRQSILIILVTLVVAEAYYLVTIFKNEEENFYSFFWIVLSVVPMYAISIAIEGSQGILQVKGVYFIPVLARLGIPIGMVLGCYFLSNKSGIYALSSGGMLGCLLGLVIILTTYWKLGVLKSCTIPILPTDTTKKLYRNLGFLIAGSAITYINPVIDQWMSKFYGAGAVAYIGYASRLTVGVASLIIGSMSPLILGYYSRSISNNEPEKIQAVFNLSFTAFTWIGCFIAISCWFLSKISVDLLYGHGNFSNHDVLEVAKLMNIYAVQFPFLFASTATYTLISAISKNELFIRFGLILLVVNIIGNWLLATYFGFYGIACSTAIVYAVSLFLMCHSLQSLGVVYISLWNVLESAIACSTTVGIGLFLYTIDYWQFVNLNDVLDYRIMISVALWLAFAVVSYIRTRRSLNFKTLE
jgi:putative peptidoglycan lipid II flippase